MTVGSISISTYLDRLESSAKEIVDCHVFRYSPNGTPHTPFWVLLVQRGTPNRIAHKTFITPMNATMFLVRNKVNNITSDASQIQIDLDITAITNYWQNKHDFRNDTYTDKVQGFSGSIIVGEGVPFAQPMGGGGFWIGSSIPLSWVHRTTQGITTV